MKKNLILAVMVCLLFACSGKTEKADDFVKNVKISKAKKVEDVSLLNFPGVVQGAHDINVGFKTAGQIQTIYVENGDYVKKGQLLAKLDPVDYKLALDAYEIQYNQVKDEVARLKSMYDAKTISDNDYEKAKSGLDQLEVQVKVYENKLKYTTLYAPTSGYIQSINNDPSEMIDAGTPLFNLLDDSKFEVVAFLPLKQYIQKDLFSEYSLSSIYLGDKEIPLNLISIIPSADENQLYEMRFLIEEDSDVITAGMNVDLLIKKMNTQRHDQYILTPHAVCSIEGKTYVWVYNNGTVNKKLVKVEGINENGDFYVSGVSEADQIVSAGGGALIDNEKVNIFKPSSKTNIGGLL